MEEQQISQWAYLRPFLDELDRTGKEDWLEDSAVATCFNCHCGFTFTVRRHHCRVCMNIFCTRCCAKCDVQIAKEERSLRLCEKCHRLIKSFTAALEQMISQKNYHSHVERLMPYEECLAQESNIEGEEDKESLIRLRRIGEDRDKEKLLYARLQEDHVRRICRKLCDDSGMPKEYIETSVDLVLHAIAAVRPSVSIGDTMKLSDYVKIKLMPGKETTSEKYVNGVVFTKNVADRKMKTEIFTPSILLISGNLTEGKEGVELGIFGEVATTGEHFANRLMKAIASIKPSIVVVEGTISVPIQDKLRDQNITVVYLS